MLIDKYQMLRRNPVWIVLTNMSKRYRLQFLILSILDYSMIMNIVID